MRKETVYGWGIALGVAVLVFVFCALFYSTTISRDQGTARLLCVEQEGNVFMITVAKGAYQENDAFVMQVLRFAYDEEVADVSYHETDIVVKTVKGFVVTRRFPEIQFIHTRDGSIIKAIVWWYGGQHQWVEKWKKILKQKEKEMKEAKKKFEKERKK